MNHHGTVQAIAYRASAVYPKIQERRLTKSEQSVVNFFGWIVNNLLYITLALVVIIWVVVILQRVKAHKRYNEMLEERYAEQARRKLAERERAMRYEAKAIARDPATRQAEMDALRRRDFASQQRALLTDSLRYDILERDGRRCRMCGATVEDGVKLHVDHIIPVSKGGRTEPSNLQVLCSRCNRGKSNKLPVSPNTTKSYKTAPDTTK